MDTAKAIFAIHLESTAAAAGAIRTLLAEGKAQISMDFSGVVFADGTRLATDSTFTELRLLV